MFDKQEPPIDIWVISHPQWVGVFMILAMIVSIGPLLVGFVLGLSVGSDLVFGIYAFMSGVVVDYALRRVNGRTLVLWRTPRILFIYFWFCLCLFVATFRPFE